MSNGGLWLVTIGQDISLPQCDVDFWEPKRLKVTTAVGIPAALLNKVKVLSDTFSKPFQVTIKTAMMDATFKKCRLVSTSEFGAMGLISSIGGGRDDEPSSRRVFNFEYMTS